MKTRDERPICFYDRLITLDEFIIYTGIYPVIVRHRYNQHMDANSIAHAKEDNRYYEFHNRLYNLTELALIANIPYSTMHQRIRKYGWTVERAVTTHSRFRKDAL